MFIGLLGKLFFVKYVPFTEFSVGCLSFSCWFGGVWHIPLTRPLLVKCVAYLLLWHVIIFFLQRLEGLMFITLNWWLVLFMSCWRNFYSQRPWSYLSTRSFNLLPFKCMSLIHLVWWLWMVEVESKSSTVTHEPVNLARFTGKSPLTDLSILRHDIACASPGLIGATEERWCEIWERKVQY